MTAEARERLADWLRRYEAAWRAPGTDGLEGVFAEGARYAQHPARPPVTGLPAIRRMWDRERPSGERFTVETWIVAAEDGVGVVRAEVAYSAPQAVRYRDLWIIRLDADGRCTDFEEWFVELPADAG